MGCDTLVARAPATRDGVALFAKNSDRPPRECQRLVQFPRRRNPPGSRVRCQYVEVPEVAETAGVLGSQPYWLWGLEHGVNEYRVAIGNEMVFAREPLGVRGLLGMDLVRLGLERGRSARHALEIITELLERYGQGGSGQTHLDWPYHNAFAIGDPDEAWLLETSGRHWAARRVVDVGNLSNGLALGTEWDSGSSDLTAFAVKQGWWDAARGRLDFAAAYADDSNVPPNLAGARRARAAALLSEGHGRLSPGGLRAILRDHYDAGPVHRQRPFDDPCFFSLCMHADPLDNTTAAMVVRLPADPAAVATVWVCLGSPCVSAFLPCYLEGRVPDRLACGGMEPDGESPWWRGRELLTLVERDFARWGPLVRARWDGFEAELEREATAVELEAVAARRAGEDAGAARCLTAFMERSVGRYLEELGRLARELGGG